MSVVAQEFIDRLTALEPRLAEQVQATIPDDALTSPDPPTGEQWEAGQVWAHLAEFIPYWIGEAHTVLAGAAVEPTPFGRTKRDPARIAAIERERCTDRDALWARVKADLDALRSFVGAVPGEGWIVAGRHPTLGEMSVQELVEEFLVGHLEEHARQLEGLASAGT